MSKFRITVGDACSNQTVDEQIRAIAASNIKRRKDRPRAGTENYDVALDKEVATVGKVVGAVVDTSASISGSVTLEFDTELKSVKAVRVKAKKAAAARA